MNKLAGFFVAIADWIALLILAALFLYSLFISRAFNFEEFHESGLEWKHNPFITLIFSAVLILILYLVYTISKRLSVNRSKALIRFAVASSGLITMILCLIWINLNPFSPRADQEHVWNAAGQLAAYLPLDESELLYFDMYPRQKSMVVLMSLVSYVSDNSLLAFKLTNTAFAVITVVFILMCYTKVSCRAECLPVLELLLVSFLPLFFYCTFIYGMLPSFALSSLSLYGLISYLESEKTVWLILPIITLPLAYLYYKATLIFVFAFFTIYAYRIAEDSLPKKWGIYLITLICVVLLINGLEKGSEIYFNNRLGNLGIGEGTTSLAHIAMGLEYSEDMHFAGGHTGRDERLYEDNDRNTEKTNEESIHLIKKYLKGYITGERKRIFFVKKTEYQWLDPWFSGLSMTVNDVISDNEKWNNFFQGYFLKGLEKYIYVHMVTVYLGAAICLLKLLIKPEISSVLAHFPGLFFTAGFIFQLFWEQKARYCLPYYLALFPLAASGFIFLFDLKDTRHRPGSGTKCTIYRFRSRV